MNRGLYLHIPFCKSKCRYCDFYSITDADYTEKYTQSIIRNIKHIFHTPRSALDAPRSIDSIYFGGGTPSLLSAVQLERILPQIPMKKNAEITMEINPDDAAPEYLKALKSMGINRLSFGIQSLRNDELAALGRRHDKQTAINAVINAEKTGFDNISVDIMLGLPGQTLGTLKKTVTDITKLPLTHISAYILKIEPNTPFYSQPEIKSSLPDDDTAADMYLQTVETLSAAGFEQYEISNFALGGYECLHNKKYWTGGEYYGIGAAAHSHIGGVRYACNMSVSEFTDAQWQDCTETEKNPGGFSESAMLALRLVKTGAALSDYPELRVQIQENASPLVKAGLLNFDGEVLTLTPEGCLVSNEIMVRLFF